MVVPAGGDGEAAQSFAWTKLIDTAGDLAVNLSVAAAILLLTVWAAGWANRFARAALARVHPRHGAPDVTLQGFGGSMARNVVLIVGLIAVLQQLGVRTTSIIAVLGAASLAVGLALQGALSNVAAGVMILMFRPTASATSSRPAAASAEWRRSISSSPNSPRWTTSRSSFPTARFSATWW